MFTRSGEHRGWSVLSRYVWVVFVALTGGSLAVADESPDFDLRVEAVGDVVQNGDKVSFDAQVVLSTQNNPEPQNGVKGWTLSLGPVGLTQVLDVTTAGTAGDGASFENTELTSGDGNAGAVSAVVLSFTEPIMLSGDGESVLLRLSGEANVPAAGCGDAGVALIDGRRGSGQPVKNGYTYAGKTFKDDGSSQDNDTDGTEPYVFELCGDGIARFVRGNCDGIGKINLTDAIYGLNYLFLGGPIPVCVKACDVNDDQGFNMTDPIYLLNYLFLSGPAPAAPFPECGVDPTDDALVCHQSHSDC